VHGLWPQYERGYPESCAVGELGNVSRELLRQIENIMPSDSLARHQWKKHGTCSGLSQRAYFNAMGDAFARVRIPEVFSQVREVRTISPKQVEAAFVSTNPGLKPEGLAVACADGNLSEVRVCMTKEFSFRPCREVDAKGCRASQIAIPPRR
jgi:ribonuclease T2